MITVARLNGSELWINQDHILFMERTPETVLTLSDGKKLTVKDSPDEIIGKVLAFRRLAAPPLAEAGSQA